MHTNANDPDPDTESNRDDGPGLARYASFDTEAGVVIYDKKNADAWIQSDAAVDIEALA